MTDSYDVVIVGAGLGGLSAAAALSSVGKSVAIVERQDGPGGNARAFKRGPYTFDPAVHAVAHGFEIEFLDFYLKAFGIDSQVELLVMDSLYATDIAGERFVLPVGIDAVIEYLGEQFPGARDGIAEYVRVAAQVTRESQAPPPRVALKDLDQIRAALPNLFAYRSSTLQSVIDEFVSDPRAAAVLAAQWPYMGVEPTRQSFMAATSVWLAMMEPGPVYVKGSFQRLADGLESAAVREGAHCLYDTAVESILVEDGAAAGVRLEDGRELRAPAVISNADARQTVETLVGAEHVPDRLMRRLQRMTPSISAFLLYSATTLPLHEMDGLAGEVFVYDHWDHDATWADIEAHRPGGMWLSLPSLHDHSLAPEGEHLVIFTSLMKYDIGEPWPEAKARYTEALIDRVERLLPGYRDAITFVDSATPETFEHYTLASQGAIYGWENVPSQTLPKRLAQESPIPGLLLAGHWTNPGTGSVRCLLSGIQAAGLLSGNPDPMAFLAGLSGG